MFDIRITHLDNIVVESSTSLFRQSKLQLRRRFTIISLITAHTSHFEIWNQNGIKPLHVVTLFVIRVRIAVLSMNVSVQISGLVRLGTNKDTK